MWRSTCNGPFRLGLAGLLVAIGLSACGGSGSKSNGITTKSPDAIVARATQAIDGVKSVRVTGTIADAGHPITLDLSLVNGRGATGSMSEDGVSFRLVTVGGEAYIYGSDAFWREFGGAGAVARLHDRWLRASADSGEFSSFHSLTDVRTLLSALLSGHGPLTRDGSSTVAGHPVIALNDTTKHGTLYVATTGPPYPIRLRNTGSEGGVLNFSDFDAPVTLGAPHTSVGVSALTG